MNKKKTIISIAIYLACLAVVICVFLFYTSNQSNKSKTTCYIATQDIVAGTVVDTNLVTSSFKQETIHNSSKDLAEEYQSTVVTEASTIINKQSVGFIPKGTILTNRMFQSINDVVEYPDFDNPQYITLPVTTESMPAEGFVKDSKISIIGLLSMSDLSSTELADKTSETWVGILTNKALVYSTIKDETKTVTNVILVVEKDVYPTLLISSNNAKIFYLKGVVNDISEVQSDVIKTIYESTGLITIEQDFKLMATDTTVNHTEYTLTFTESNDEKLNNLNIIYVGEGNSLNISWNGSPTRAFIKHYNLTDGRKGVFYGSYSYAATDSKKKINYNSNLEEHSFAVSFDKEGFYEISFYNQDSSFVGKTTFVVESKIYSWRTKDSSETSDVAKIDAGSIKIGMIQEEKNGITYVIPEYSATNHEYEITCQLVKEYFKKIDSLKNYTETIQFESALNGNNIYTTEYVIDKKEKIGCFLGDTIKDVNIILTIDGVEVSVPLFYKIADAGIDYSATSDQIAELRGYLNATIDDNSINEKYTYSELESLLAQLEEIKDYLYDEADESNRNYTILSYLLRFVLVKQDMTLEEFVNLHNQLYIVSDNGIPYKNPDASLEIELKLENSNESYRLNLDFISKFSLTSTEKPVLPAEPSETPNENGGTN